MHNDPTFRQVGGVANNNVIQTFKTNNKGLYKFKIYQTGPYVVREVVPAGYVQTTPTFTTAKPSGSLSPGYTGASWNYKSGSNNPANGIPVGPANWSTIAPAGTLPFESPINIQGAPIDLSQVLSINYNNTVPTHLVNTGAQVQVQFIGSSTDSLTLGGQQYALQQFHYHDPAENLVNGYTYPMEEHFVNTTAAGAETVVGVFLQLGEHNTAFDQILNAAAANLDNTPANSSVPGSTIGTVDFAGLLPTSMQGWFFQGSLTTPPLSQVVNWFVLATPITLDAGQLALYQKIANDNGYLPNARPVQPLDGRVLNEIDYNVNFVNQFTAQLNFNVNSTQTATAATSGANSKTHAESVQALSLPVLQSTTSHMTLQAAEAAQNYSPVAGCNCPLCQMLRNATWQQVTQSGLQAAIATLTPTASTTAASAAL